MQPAPVVTAESGQQLLEAAEQVLAAKGPGASTDEIAKAAGVGIGTLFRHFPTKEALIEGTSRAVEYVGPDPAARARIVAVILDGLRPTR